MRSAGEERVTVLASRRMPFNADVDADMTATLGFLRITGAAGCSVAGLSFGLSFSLLMLLLVIAAGSDSFILPKMSSNCLIIVGCSIMSSIVKAMPCSRAGSLRFGISRFS